MSIESSAAVFHTYTKRFILGLALSLLVVPVHQMQADEPNHANYEAAQKYSSTYLRQFSYSTSVRPRWIGKSNRFWYSYRTSTGTQYWLVDAKAKTKTSLFDRDKLAALLSIEVKKPLDAANLSLSGLTFTESETAIKFVAERIAFEYDLTKETLTNKGKPTTPQRATPPSTSEGGRQFRRTRSSSTRSSDYRNFSPDKKLYLFARKHNLFLAEAEIEPKAKSEADAKNKPKTETSKKTDQDKDSKNNTNEKSKTDSENKSKTDSDKKSKTDSDKKSKSVTEKKDKVRSDKNKSSKTDEKAKNKTKGEQVSDDKAKTETDNTEDSKEKSKSKTNKNGSDDNKATSEPDDNNKSKSDSKDKAGKDDKSKTETDNKNKSKDKSGQGNTSKTETDDKNKTNDKSKSESKDKTSAGDKAKPAAKEAKKPSKEDEAIQLTKDGETDYSFGGDDTDRKRRPRASWSKDSKAFYITRSDSRGVAELFLVNSLAQPRPTLQKYKYPLPGEKKVRVSELSVYHIESKKWTRVKPKWKDESYSNIHWGKTSDKLRFVRRDRLVRSVDVCELDIKTGKCQVLFSENVNNANLATQSLRYINDDADMIWWSERSGWGHFYLYDRNGKLKNAITSGPWRAVRVVSVDEKKGLLYFTGNAREKGENVYYPHLYCCFLDGTGLTLLDPGDAYHRSSLSSSRKYIVDNCSRIDMAPRSLLRDSKGNKIMDLEEADLSKLRAAGWKMPERFSVKANDGVTDLYGNMWKPFDFDPSKKYPIIVHVYPGPQTEGVSHTFSSANSRQQMAQLGFIVVQVGHRGGSPQRSKAYGSYGYYNLRDFGLADKKAALEQLAARHSFIDIKRVGIYGHSGGGFMTAAALMQKPYNDFFKVGVSSSGNHDNNVYGSYWAERYHGLKEVAVKEEKKTQDATGTRTRRSTQRTGAGDQEELRDEEDIFEDDHQDGFENAANSIIMRQTLIEPYDEKQKSEKKTKRKNREGKKDKRRKRKKDKTIETKKDDAKKDDTKKDDTKKDDTKKDDTKKDDTKKDDTKKDDTKKDDTKKDDTKKDDTKKDDTKKDDTKKDDTKKDDTKKDDTKKGDTKKDSKQETKFEIHIPTNAELAANLKGRLLLVHGDIDNNVHPAGTMRLVDALIKANKRFDMLIIPGKRHSYGDASAYFNQRMWEYFAEHLLGDYQPGADIGAKSPTKGLR